MRVNKVIISFECLSRGHMIESNIETSRKLLPPCTTSLTVEEAIFNEGNNMRPSDTILREMLDWDKETRNKIVDAKCEYVKIRTIEEAIRRIGKLGNLQ